MSGTASFSAAQRTEAFGERSGFDTDAEAKDLLRTADEAVRLTLEHGTSAGLATNTRNRNTTPETLRAPAGREQHDDADRLVNMLPPRPPRRVPSATFHALQEWEGYVVDVGAADFVARLVDLTAGSSHEEEEAVIPLTELSDTDADRMRSGSIFRWVIGYERSASGTKKRVSQIVLRDLPRMTKADLREGREWARETMQSLGL